MSVLGFIKLINGNDVFSSKKAIQYGVVVMGFLCGFVAESCAKPFVVMMLGAPGSGKGTMAERVSAHYKIPIITASRLLAKVSQDDSELSRSIAETMRQGRLVSDEQISSLVAKEIKLPQYARGYILDGFPRTLGQAKLLNKDTIDVVVMLDIDPEIIVTRMQGRRIHQASGRIYHVETKPPRKEGLDDVTGEPLMQREDDKAEVVYKRLQLYRELTAPVESWALEMYERGRVKRIVRVDAALPMDQVWQNLVQKLPALNAVVQTEENHEPVM